MKAKRFYVEAKAYIIVEKRFEEHLANSLRSRGIGFDEEIDHFESSYHNGIVFSLFALVQKLQGELAGELAGDLLRAYSFIYTEVPEETQEPSAKPSEEI